MPDSNRKYYIKLGIMFIAISIILEYIFNLIFHQRNLIEGLVYAISIGLVYSIVITVGFHFLKKRKEKKEIKSSNI